MSYAILQNRRANNNNPTHRNELFHIGAVYLNSANDIDKVTSDTIDLLCGLNNELFLELQDRCHILPSDNGGASSLQELTECILSHEPLTIFSGGTYGILGLNKIIERGAHDYIHFLIQADFTLAGEYQAFIKTAELVEQYGKANQFRHFTISQAISVVYSEIYLQAAAWDYFGGNYPPEQKIVLLNTPYRVNYTSVSSKAKPGYVG
jgi:hypothetical protein